MEERAARRLRLVPDEYDQLLRLGRFREDHLAVVIGAGNGWWQALIPEPNGEIVTTRYTLRALLDKLDDLLSANPGQTPGRGVGRAADHRSIAQPLDPDHEHEIIGRIHQERDQPSSCGPKCSVRSGMDTSSRSSRRPWYCTGSTITTASMNAASDARTAGFRSANCC